MRRINEIIYAGAFIRQEDKANLFGLIPLNFKRDKDVQYPHVTSFFHTNIPLDAIQWVLNHDGEDVTIQVDGISISNEVCALRVQSVKALDGTIMPSTNRQQHITLSTISECQPVDANKITSWRTIDTLNLKGYVRIIYKKSISV